MSGGVSCYKTLENSVHYSYLDHSLAWNYCLIYAPATQQTRTIFFNHYVLSASANTFSQRPWVTCICPHWHWHSKVLIITGTDIHRWEIYNTTPTLSSSCVVQQHCHLCCSDTQHRHFRSLTLKSKVYLVQNNKGF